MTAGGGRFDFDDGGTYCGGWEDGKAHGHGVCTGPKGQGEYAGAWQYGFEISGVYTWPSGNCYKGQWFQGKRHGLGSETKGRWIYRGEWTQGFKGRYGVRQSTTSGARYEGTWTTGLQDGYGCETYADGEWITGGDGAPGSPPATRIFGSYQGQWLRGTRHGYGVRQSVPYGLASHYRPKALRTSLTSLRSENEDEQVVKNRDKKLDESRGGFVLKARSDETPPTRRRSIFDKQGRSSLRKTLMSGLKLKKQKSTGDINDSPKRQTGSVRSTVSNISHMSADSTQSGMTNTSVYTDSNLSFVSQDDITDVNVTETYMGEWKNDKRSGFGVSERSDGLKYEGEWYNNKKYGYGVTTFKDGSKEEGKYKNNVLISSGKKNKLFLIRTSKLRERVDNAVLSAQRAAQIALQKADIAITRMANARAKAEQADMAAQRAEQDCDVARLKAKQYAPEFHQPGTDIIKKQLEDENHHYDFSHIKPMANHAPFRSKSMSARAEHEQQYGGQPPGGGGGGMPPGMMTSQYPGTPNDRRPGSDFSYLNSDLGGGGGGGGMGPPGVQENMQALNVAQHSRSPSLRVRRYSFLAGSRRGRGFSEIFNSTILNDHFDQYSADQRDDSGLGREIYPGEEGPPRGGTGGAGGHNPALPSDTSPDSGVSDSMDDDSKNRPLQRRRTLPCIVNNPGGGTANPGVPPAAAHGGQGGGAGVAGGGGRELVAAKQKVVARETAVSSENLKNPETYIIENGIRKRVRAEVHGNPRNPEKGQLPSEYKIVSQKGLTESAKRGSLPDLKQLPATPAIPREEAYRLGSARRDEIRRLQELAERRRQGDMGVILGDIRDWCQERQLLVLVIALNVSLATMFFNMLS